MHNQDSSLYMMLSALTLELTTINSATHNLHRMKYTFV